MSFDHRALDDPGLRESGELVLELSDPGDEGPHRLDLAGELALEALRVGIQPVLASEQLGSQRVGGRSDGRDGGRLVVPARLVAAVAEAPETGPDAVRGPRRRVRAGRSVPPDGRDEPPAPCE